MRPTDIPKATDTVRCEQLDDELILYSDKDTRMVALDPIASLVWNLCDGERNVTEIEAVLTEAYPDAKDHIPTDVKRAIGELLEGGVLQLVPLN